MKLLIATRNRHKLEEIDAILDWPGLEIISTDDDPELPEVEEDADSFQGNAVKKAVTLARASGLWTLADDSGLEVDSLGGAPGVYSARYAGEPVNYRANNEKLLRELGSVANRRGRFRCAMALSSPAEESWTVEGACEGVIVEALRGEDGFGYDPLFQPDGYDQTFAEMDAGLKNRISHRAAALRQARSVFEPILARSVSV